MALAQQINTIVNKVSQQTLGQSAIQVVNTQTLIALGDTVLSSEQNVLNFGGTLTTLIGETIISMRAYNPEMVDTVIHSFEFGLILRKIYVDIPDVQVNNSWNVGESDYTPDFAPVFTPTVKEHLFSNVSTFSINVTIPDNLFKVAFRSAEDMGVLISAIFLALDNKLMQSLENMIMITRASFIARKLTGTASCQAVNLLPSYNTAMGSSLTQANCLYNPDFLRWSSEQIRLWRKRMRKLSVLFNQAGYKRHTPENDATLLLLDEYDSALVSYLQSSTYHDELVRIANFATVPYWQGSGTNFSFSDTSSINIQLSPTQTVSAKGIIGILYDYQALGVMMDDNRMVSQRNDLDEYTTYAQKINRGYFNDMSENGIVFYVSDSDYTVATVTDGSLSNPNIPTSSTNMKKTNKRG